MTSWLKRLVSNLGVSSVQPTANPSMMKSESVGQLSGFTAYGQREYGARDPEGHRWWFATPVSAPPTS